MKHEVSKHLSMRLKPSVIEELRKRKTKGKTWNTVISELLFLNTDEFEYLYRFFTSKMFEIEKSLSTGSGFDKQSPSKVEFLYKLLLVDLLAKLGKRVIKVE